MTSYTNVTKCFRVVPNASLSQLCQHKSNYTDVRVCIPCICWHTCVPAVKLVLVGKSFAVKMMFTRRIGRELVKALSEAQPYSDVEHFLKMNIGRQYMTSFF